MCRLSLFSKAGEQYIENTFGLLKLLDKLERSAGGQGNGLALLKDGEIIFLNKGTKYTNESIVKKLQRTDYDWAIYHTRIKSVGEVSNKNCHPYRSGDTVIAMNGTESGFSQVANMLDITDTEAVLRTAVAFNKDIREVCADVCGSTFVGFYKGKPFVVPNTRSDYSGLQFVIDEDVVVYASVLPEKFKGRMQMDGKRHWFWADDPAVLDSKHCSKVRGLESYARNLGTYMPPSYSGAPAREFNNPVPAAQRKTYLNNKWVNVGVKDEEEVKDNILDDMQTNFFTDEDVNRCR